MLPDDDPKHGTLNGYKNFRCRCTPCCETESRYEKRRKWLVHQGLNPTLPAAGFQRRVRALMAIGWTQRSLADALGIAPGNLAAKMRAGSVYRATHVAMCEVYEARCMSPQQGVSSARTAQHAAKNGWPSPLAWDDIDNDPEPPPVESADNYEDTIDHVVVRRVVDSNERSRKLTRTEAAEVVRLLLLSGLSTYRIENEYGLKVDRYWKAAA